LRKAAGLPPPGIALLREVRHDVPRQPEKLAALIKAVPLTMFHRNRSSARFRRPAASVFIQWTSI
jgi:hypothetical protein